MPHVVWNICIKFLACNVIGYIVVANVLVDSNSVCFDYNNNEYNEFLLYSVRSWFAIRQYKSHRIMIISWELPLRPGQRYKTLTHTQTRADTCKFRKIGTAIKAAFFSVPDPVNTGRKPLNGHLLEVWYGKWTCVLIPSMCINFSSMDNFFPLPPISNVDWLTLTLASKALILHGSGWGRAAQQMCHRLAGPANSVMTSAGLHV